MQGGVHKNWKIKGSTGVTALIGKLRPKIFREGEKRAIISLSNDERAFVSAEEQEQSPKMSNMIMFILFDLY